MSTRSGWVAVAGLGLLALALRLFGLNSPLWYDEIATVVQSLQGPLRDVVTSYPSNNDHPLYSALAKLSMMAFGETPLALRLPAAMFGAAAVPALWWLGQKVAPPREAAAAAVLLAVAYHAVWYAQNARGYTMMLFFAMICTGLLYDLMRGTARAPRLAWAGYALCLALAAYTHLTMVLVGVAHGLVVLGHHLIARRPLAAWAAPALGFGLAGLITLVLYAPMMGDLVVFFLGSDAPTAAPDPETGGADTLSYGVLAALYELSLGFGGPVVAGSALLLLGLGFLSYARRAPAMTALFVAPVPVILAATILLERPFFPRFFFFSAGFLVLMGVRGVAVGLLWSLPKIGKPGWNRAAFGLAMLAVTLVSASALSRNYTLPKQNYPAALALLQAEQDTAPVYVVSKTAELPFNRYLNQSWPRLRTGDDFQAALAARGRIQVVYTFETYIRLGAPGLWQNLQAHCEWADEVPATVSGGEIHRLICETGGQA